MRKTTAMLLTGALATGAALTVLSPGVASASCAGPQTVTDQSKGNWQIPYFEGETGATTAGSNVTFVGENLQLDIAPAGRAVALYPISTAGVPLSQQTAESDYTIAGDATKQLGFSYQLTLDYNGSEAGGFTTLVQEPAARSGWYSTRPLTAVGPNFGNGNQENTATLQQISAAYPNAVIQAFGLQLGKLGDATATATASVDTVKFGCNVFDFKKAAVTPTNQAPVAALTATQPDADGNVTFTSQSTDDKGIVTQHLDYGDGNSTDGGPNDNGPVTHKYAPGTYTATLTVTDAEGLTSSDKETITVKTPVVAPTNQGNSLPNTGADVMGIAGLGAVLIVGAGAGMVVTRRRKARHTA